MSALAPAERRPFARVLGGFAVDAGLAFVGVVLLSLAMMFGWAVWVTVTGDSSAADALRAPIPLTVQMVLAAVATGLPALALFAWRRVDDATCVPPADVRTSALWAIATAVAVQACTVAVLVTADHLDGPVRASNRALVEQGLAAWPWAVVAFAVVLAPVYEELLFRGVFFRRFWLAGYPYQGMALSAVAFALAHELPSLGQHVPVAAAALVLAYGFAGFAFAWVHRRTGRLATAIGAHALSNALGLGALWLAR